MSADSENSIAEAAWRVANSDEALLVRRLRANEEDAYRDFLRIYGGRLLAVARRMMRDEENARDCVQDAFLSAIRAIHRFGSRRSIG